MGIAELRSEAEAALRIVLGGARRVALVNFPNHGNPGDPGLWLGTHALLASIGVRVVYEAAPWSLDLAALDRAVGDSPVLINGGGNFGDLYVGQQEARMRLIAGWTGRRLIQLPQSIEFSNPQIANAVAAALRSHGAFTMMVRDYRSQELSRSLLNIDPVLSPDQIFGLGQLTPSNPNTREVLWMVWPEGAREFTAQSQPAVMPPGVLVEDWHTGAALAHESFDRRGRIAWRLNRAFEARWSSPAVRRGWPVLRATFAPLARRWFTRGVDLVDSSRVLVTNKLHGHLVATLLGKPHVVMDNSYGKVGAALDTWTGELAGVHVARDGAEAMELANKILEAGR
jgi:exopolysaccharide biosynthesis predicted pyruvyltransferase EpsI